MGIKRRLRVGFTLIELMLVVAIISMLSAIAIPKFSNLIRKSKEAALRGTTGTLHAALNLYYADNEGVQYPEWTTGQGLPLLVPKYLREIPEVNVPYWDEDEKSNELVSNIIPTCDLAHAFNQRYVYQDLIAPPRYILHVACMHRDLNNRSWTTR